MENKLRVSRMLEIILEDENYENARVLVFDENNNLIVSEELFHILFETYKMLKSYELVEWNTDCRISGNKKINTVVIFAKKVSKASL